MPHIQPIIRFYKKTASIHLKLAASSGVHVSFVTVHRSASMRFQAHAIQRNVHFPFKLEWPDADLVSMVKLKAKGRKRRKTIRGSPASSPEPELEVFISKHRP